MMSANDKAKDTRPHTGAERMQKHREKMQAIAAGTYKKPLVEEAKDSLREMEKPNLAIVLSQEKYRDTLTEEERSQLKTFLSNHK